MEEIINDKLYIKLGQFVEEELEVLKKKKKRGKAAGLNENTWKTRKFDDTSLIVQCFM